MDSYRHGQPMLLCKCVCTITPLRSFEVVCSNLNLTLSLKGERATGYGVALLVTLFGNYSSQGFLQNMSSLAFDEVFEKYESCKKFKRN